MRKRKTASEKINNIFPYSRSSNKRWVKVGGGQMFDEFLRRALIFYL